MNSIIKHPTAGQREGQRGGKAGDTESIGAAANGKSERQLFTYCRPLQVDKATWESSFPLTWPW